MTEEQKALKACADYARLGTEIKRLTRLIGDSIEKCPGVNGHLIIAESDNDIWDQSRYDRQAKDQTHLKSAYTPWIDDDSLVYLDKDQIDDVLSGCRHCRAAHEAIQARKAARRSLGAAKRQIGLIGRKVAV